MFYYLGLEQLMKAGRSGTAAYYVVVFDPLLIAIGQVVLGQKLGVLGPKRPAKRQMRVFS